VGKVTSKVVVRWGSRGGCTGYVTENEVKCVSLCGEGESHYKNAMKKR
jgi:hypothetical protein